MQKDYITSMYPLQPKIVSFWSELISFMIELHHKSKR